MYRNDTKSYCFRVVRLVPILHALFAEWYDLVRLVRFSGLWLNRADIQPYHMRYGTRYETSVL